jgi:N-methylhydantoinase B
VYFVAQENYPVEFLEQGYPVRLLRYGINCDSGGAGRFRGGAGVVREYEVLAEHAVLSMRIDSVVNPPWGVGGGMRGGTGRAVVNPGTPHERKLAPLSDGTVLRRGDILLLETGGGGGQGHPLDRPAEQVLQDVRGETTACLSLAMRWMRVTRGGCVVALMRPWSAHSLRGLLWHDIRCRGRYRRHFH